MKKKNMKWKKLGSTGNMGGEHNTWWIKKATEINMTNGQQKTELPHAREAIEDYWARYLSRNL